MTIVNPPTYAQRYAAHAKAMRAKERMDEALAALEKAEDEWHQACQECDRLDQPTAYGELARNQGGDDAAR